MVREESLVITCKMRILSVKESFSFPPLPQGNTYIQHPDPRAGGYLALAEGQGYKRVPGTGANVDEG